MERIRAVLGPRGTFTSEAAYRYWGRDAGITEMSTIEEVFRAIVNNEAAEGMVPLENNLIGGVAVTMDNLEEKPVFIAGEIVTPINQCLLAPIYTSLSEIEVVVSQFHALMQCERFLQTFLPGVRREVVETTAYAAMVVRTDTRRAAAIGPYQAAEIYGLKVIRAGVQDNDNNKTRFIHISSIPKKSDKADKSSLIFSLGNEPGRLYQVLGVVVSRNINIAKIEPIPRRRPDEYRFFVDIEGTLEDEEVVSALDELRGICTFYRYLGSYPSWRDKPAGIQRSTGSMVI